MSPTGMADSMLQLMESTLAASLAAFAVGVVVCVVAYVAFQRFSMRAHAASVAQAPVVEGTKFVEEEGHLVRRSTRYEHSPLVLFD